MNRTDELEQRLAAVRSRIARAASAAGRDADEITLVAITKYFPAQDAETLVRLGVTDIGENKDQEAGAKIAELDPVVREAITVHFVGQLQSNKAGHVASYADVVQSVDRVKIARALGRAATSRDRTLAVLLQVDLDGSDPGRGGVLTADLPELAEQTAQTPGLSLRGLMAVAPRGADPDAAFAQLAELSEQLRRQHPDATWISAGMSGDLEAAIAHGATHVRIGSAILGPRPAP